jgi:hypothetical protein
MKRVSSLLLVVIFIESLAFAQVVIPASGGNISGVGGIVSYSVGQVFYTTGTGSTGSAVQGVQQPYEISVTTAIKKAKGIDLVYSVYPNPVSDLLTLKIDDYDIENLSWQLYNINGNLLENKKVTGEETIISMKNLVPSIYYLKITDNRNEIKTIKIIKK